MEADFKYSLEFVSENSVIESKEVLTSSLTCFEEQLNKTGKLDTCLNVEDKNIDEIIKFRKKFLEESAIAILVNPEEGLFDEDIRINSFEEVHCKNIKKAIVECRIVMDVDATFGVQSNGLD